MLGSSSGSVQSALNKRLRSEPKSMLSISVFTGETEERSPKESIHPACEGVWAYFLIFIESLNLFRRQRPSADEGLKTMKERKLHFPSLSIRIAP